ncbi:hypothetical protein AUC70_03225 [Methyloceanibacter stevinii]|uniref:Uncharacterized protein n=1 Tax=Methyloceanibacter stevinii TaxID=1774970 RepID=A0A1E3VQT6_9HYPH|nr:hypothetical protein [Methyloceanibacter stevinii]ODR95883.1 hypothetical protein AUC70_03225 [Methyloceanibacter stevinii]
MKAITHIGTGKAGSTTIQKSTFANRAALLEHGILIPQLRGSILPHRDLADAITGQASQMVTNQIRSTIENDIALHKPQALFLSSEYLCYGGNNPANATALRDFLTPWTNELEAVLYLREPVGFYVSSCQQALKATDKIVDPAVWRFGYRQLVEDWREQYGDRLTIIPFQGSAFPEGLVTNLFRRLLPDFANSGLELDNQSSNRSDPVEVSCLMQAYFRLCYPGEPREFRDEATKLNRLLNRIAIEAGIIGKPQVKPRVAATILSSHLEDLTWLEAEEGIRFDGLDYSAHAGEKLLEPHNGQVQMSDIVEVKPDELQALTALAAKRAMTKIAKLEEKQQRLMSAEMEHGRLSIWAKRRFNDLFSRRRAT